MKIVLDQSAPEWAHDMARQVNAGLDAAARGALPRHTVATLPKAIPAGRLIIVTDETGGEVPAFSDGSDWRRVTDRNVVS